MHIDYKPDEVCIVMPFYEMPLNRFPRERLSDPVRLDLIYSILSTLEYIHAMGVIHCDIKPNNIYVVKRGEHFECIIADFGLSMMKGSPRICHYVQTVTHRAPEVVVGARITSAIDIWSVGIILLELIGRRVYIAGIEDTIFYAAALYKITPVPGNRTATDVAIVAAGEHRHRAGIMGFSQRNDLIYRVLCACLQYNNRPTAYDVRRLIVRDARRVSVVPFETDIKLGILINNKTDLDVSTLASGISGISKCVTGRIPYMTDDELKNARKLSSKSAGRLLFGAEVNGVILPTAADAARRLDAPGQRH